MEEGSGVGAIVWTLASSVRGATSWVADGVGSAGAEVTRDSVSEAVAGGCWSSEVEGAMGVVAAAFAGAGAGRRRCTAFGPNFFPAPSASNSQNAPTHFSAKATHY